MREGITWITASLFGQDLAQPLVENMTRLSVCWGSLTAKGGNHYLLIEHAAKVKYCYHLTCDICDHKQKNIVTLNISQASKPYVNVFQLLS